jgi:hypothetical protein
MRLWVESTGEVVDLVQDSTGSRVRAWVWHGEKDGVDVRIYVAGFDAPSLRAAAPPGSSASVEQRAVPPEDPDGV